MSAKLLASLGFSASALSILWLALNWVEVVASDQERPAPPQLVKIKLTAEPDEVIVGDVVRLTATVPKTFHQDVLHIAFDILLIGRYDPQNEALVNLQGEEFKVVHIDPTFEGLASVFGFSHPCFFDVQTPRLIGMEFECKAKRLGIFLISTSWGNSHGPDISSNPVVLTVKPPAAAVRKKQLKPEWLRED